MKVFFKDDVEKVYTDIVSSYMKKGFRFTLKNDFLKDRPPYCHLMLSDGESSVSVAIEKINGGVTGYHVVARELKGDEFSMQVFAGFYDIAGKRDIAFTDDSAAALLCAKKRNDREKSKYSILDGRYIYRKTKSGSEIGYVSEGLKASLLKIVRKQKGMKRTKWVDVVAVQFFHSACYCLSTINGGVFKNSYIGEF